MKQIKIFTYAGEEAMKARTGIEQRVNDFLREHQGDNPVVQPTIYLGGINKPWYYFSVTVEYEERGTICPDCEKNEIVEGDYLCRECR